MSQTISTGGILAAGEGSRLKRDGWRIAKPLVPVGGVPLLEHVLGNFQAAGIGRVTIIFNEEEEECARIARESFPGLDLDIVIRTTASSYESYRTIAPRLGTGAALVSTVDAWCPRADFLAFVKAAGAAPDETVLAVTRYVEDERPLWVSFDRTGRVTSVGGASGEAVTAGMYVFPERVRRDELPADLPRLRDYLAWLVDKGERVRSIPIPKVVDVDRATDVAAAEAMAHGAGRGTRDGEREGPPGSSPDFRVPSCSTEQLSRLREARFGGRRKVAAQHESRAGNAPRCWGIYRELAHSPGRETDDAEILRATARSLSDRGFEVELKSPDELPEDDDAAGIPPFLFVMCERETVVRRLSAWERQGVRIVNRPSAIRNTDRERAIPLFSDHRVPFPHSSLVPTAVPQHVFPLPCWIKRADVHATQVGDVSFAQSPEELADRLSALRARGIPQAVLQEHVPGDLIKFYGVREANEENGPLSWFEWFYHRDQQLSRYPFAVLELQEAVARAAGALGLDVFGGDAIATQDGRVILIDLNAWPSFALYRREAAERIAAHLALRFQRTPVALGVRRENHIP